MSRTFSSSVPNTYVATLASLQVGWGGIKGDRHYLPINGPAAACECGRPKPLLSKACFRCASIDVLTPGGRGDVLRLLEDYEARSVYEIATGVGLTPRSIIRIVKPLVASGQIRAWIEEPDTVAGGFRTQRAWGGTEVTVKNNYAGHAKKLYRRVW